MLDREVEGKQLPVKSAVLHFGSGKLLGVVSQGLVLRALAEDGADGHIRRVRSEEKGAGGVRVHEHSGPRQAPLGGRERRQLGVVANQDIPLLGHGRHQLVKGSQHRSQLGDETVVKVDAPQETL